MYVLEALIPLLELFTDPGHECRVWVCANSGHTTQTKTTTEAAVSVDIALTVMQLSCV
jgi:hypothetical protein